MNRLHLVKFVSVVMAVVFPAAMMSAEIRGALVSASSGAMLNGVPVQRNATVFAGDKLQVPADSSATITVKGTSILVPAYSTVTYNGDSVSLDYHTAVAITTTTGMAARIQDLKISPAQSKGKFEVARFNGNIYVAAKQGSVMIADASGNHLVAEGGRSEVRDPEPQKPGSVPATTGAGVGGFGNMPTWVAVLIGLAAAGAAAAAAVATTGKPVSPAHP